jgi:hypothetical protein
MGFQIFDLRLNTKYRMQIFNLGKIFVFKSDICNHLDLAVFTLLTKMLIN